MGIQGYGSWVHHVLILYIVSFVLQEGDDNAYDFLRFSENCPAQYVYGTITTITSNSTAVAAYMCTLKRQGITHAGCEMMIDAQSPLATLKCDACQ